MSNKKKIFNFKTLKAELSLNFEAVAIHEKEIKTKYSGSSNKYPTF